MRSRHRRTRAPEVPGPARAGTSASGATSTASDERGAALPPPPPLRATAEAWLPPPAFLPPGWTAPVPLYWTYWESSRGTPHRPRTAETTPAAGRVQDTLRDLAAALDAERVYASVDDLARAMHAQLAALAGSTAGVRIYTEFIYKMTTSIYK